jgi:hypothetical protein
MRHPRLSLLASLFLALTFLVVPSAALGAANHPLLTTIPGHDTPNKAFEDVCGLTLHGGLYVADYYHDAIDAFAPEGSYESQFPNEDPGNGPCQLAFDAAGNLYVANWHQNVVKYGPSELLPGAGTVIDSDNPTGLAVDQASGNLYVAHRTYVAEYNSAGTLITDEIGLGTLEEAYGVAISEFPATAGNLYIPDAASHTVRVFNPAVSLTVPVAEINGAATPQGRFTYLRESEVIVDNNPSSPSFGHVYVLDAIGHGLSDHPEGALDEFNAAGAYRGQIRRFSDAEPSGVAISSDGKVYVGSGNSEGAQVIVYGSTAPPQTLTVEKTGAGGGEVTTSPNGIRCGQACVAEFNEEQLVALFATPNAHSVFTGWSVTGSEPCPGVGTCQVLMGAHVEVDANFEEPTQATLSVSASGEGTVTTKPAAISCPGACIEHFNEGRVVTLIAHPGAHQELVGWSGCTVQANPDECKVTMSEARAVSVTFAPIPQLALSVISTGTGQGTVTSYPPGISCPGTCLSNFDEGLTVYLMAAPSPGSGFGGFTGGGCTGTATLCAVPIASAQSVSATFTGAAAGPRAAVASLRVASVRTTPSAAVLSVRTEEAGTLVAFGGGLSPLRQELFAGTTTLRLRLSPAARKRLERRGRLALGLRLGFIPAAGDAAAMTRSLAFHFRISSPAGFNSKGGR